MLGNEIEAGLWALALLGFVYALHTVPSTILSLFEEPEWWKEFFKTTLVGAAFLSTFLLFFVALTVVVGFVFNNNSETDWHTLWHVWLYGECFGLFFSLVFALDYANSPNPEV